MRRKTPRWGLLVGSAFMLTLFGCTTKISYFNAIESGPNDGQSFVGVVSNTHDSGGNIIKHQSAILEFQETPDGTWRPKRVVVEGVDSQIEKLLEALRQPARAKKNGPRTKKGRR